MQANDAVASERSIFSENQDYRRFFRVTVNPYIPIFWGECVTNCYYAWWQKTTSRQTDRQTDTHTHTHTHGTTTVTLAVHACRGLIIINKMKTCFFNTWHVFSDPITYTYM